MFSYGQRVSFYDGRELHFGLVQRVCRYHHIVLEDDPDSPDGITKWRIAPCFLAATPDESMQKYRAYQRRTEQIESNMQEARNLCRVTPHTLVEVNSPRRGRYNGYVLKVNRNTVDLYTPTGFIRVDKCLITNA